MKNKILLFTLIFISSFSVVDAGTIFPNITVTGTTLADTTGNGNGGKLVFPTISGVVINTVAYNSNPSADLQISGNFWLQSLSSYTDPTLGWVTFDIGIVTGAQKVVLKNNLDNTFTFNGFAWSKAAGWIYFSPINLVDGNDNTKVVYNRTTGLINGCAWSQNLGWICIDNFVLDTTPPDINTYLFSGAFAADHNKNIDIQEAVNEVSIENWNNTLLFTRVINNFNHDFRQVKGYFMEVVDTTGNIGTGTLNVVAAIPSTTFDNTHKIDGATAASTFSATYSSEERGDGNAKHNIKFTLKDTYGNIIKNETGIKDVKVGIKFYNTVDKDQISNGDLGDAINYGTYDFGTINRIDNTGTGYNDNAIYNIDIKSLAPTKAGYNYITGNNDIKLSNLNILITALGKIGVGETNLTNLFYSDYNNKNFKFTPIVKVDALSNDRNNYFLRDVETTFTGSVIVDPGSNDISNIDITHKLSTSNNFIINFQNLDITNFIRTYIGYLKPDSTNTDFYYYSNGNGIPESPISKIIKYLAGTYDAYVTLNDGFKATPKIVVGGTTNFDVNYNSEISYNIGGENIKYSSFATGATNSLGNREIKIAGIAHRTDKSFSVISDSSINYVGKLNKMQVYAQIKKNATKYKNIGTSIIDGVKYVTGTSYNLDSWPAGVDTIIVDGADIIIEEDIFKVNGKLKTIIALKNGEIGGNIWIRYNVQFIGAVLVSDRSILSGDGTVYYTDNGEINTQLFIKGSVLSYNTIGGASSAIPKCPFYITGTCNEQISKRYDLNHLRSFINTVGNSVVGVTYGVDMTNIGYAEAPVIVEYDADVQTKSPKIFTINN